ENEEVISGDWQSIKKALTENSSKRIKALYWYSLPDGSYYTSARDKVEATLSDREYFQSLKKGNNVVGYPIIGKTSGKKSFVIAVPIIKEEEVVGMLGSSVFLNEFWNYLKEQIKIPSDYDFYTIAADGITIFDLESKDLMLNDTLEESSTSLVAAVEEIISKKDGIVTYEWNEKEKTAIFTKSHVCDWRYVLSYID
ncbi:MAG: cache domain-containing protein, partial [Candidatus Cloacimonetes bacterium]|nr:cache domain-containing protein [Candidatus Cloacimonadota bacterium]